MRRYWIVLGLVVVVAALSVPTVGVRAAVAQTADPVMVAVGDISPDPSVPTSDDLRTAALDVAANPTVVA
jgi:hypothetical protein